MQAHLSNCQSNGSAIEIFSIKPQETKSDEKDKDHTENVESESKGLRCAEIHEPRRSMEILNYAES